jgi:NAD(P)-dependent dehydrogenase (short-subunit alcohol dehydrogenase family)
VSTQPCDRVGGETHGREDRWDAIVRQIPLGYMGDPNEDIGRGVLALVTDLRYLTGATVALDGGRCILR